MLDADTGFVDAIEIARSGYILANDQSQYLRWQHAVNPARTTTTLTDLAMQFPDHVRPN